MSIKLIAPCVGRQSCAVFKSPEALLAALGSPNDFKNLMMAMEVVKSWRRSKSCPFRVQNSEAAGGDGFHVAICSLASKPPFSMEAVSHGTGYSKTCVAKIEYAAFKKIKRAMGKEAIADEVLEGV